MYNLIGQTFGRLYVLERDHSVSGFRKETRWFCKCECGNISSVRSYLLRTGHTKSCGCLVKEHAEQMNPPKHGMHNTPTYHTWEGMKQRCLNPEATRYPEYGAKGITVCERWLSFENFFEDMGERPEGKTLDRINPFGNYEPNNCRWATPKEQANNQKRHWEEVHPFHASEM